MWSLSFHLIENYVEDLNESEFGNNLFTIAMATLAEEESIVPGIKGIVSSGLSRLLTCEVFAIKQANQIVSICLEQLKNSSGKVVQDHCIKLLITCIYVFGISIGDDFDTIDDTKVKQSNLDEEGRPCSEMSGRMKTSSSREELVTAMEKISVLFDRLRVTSSGLESKLVSKVIPIILTDFFPPQDSLNKIIGEFLSLHQSDQPQYLAQIVFDTFTHYQSINHGDLVQEWVLLSLASFVQLDPVSVAIWYLNVFLISSSSNQWIRAM